MRTEYDWMPGERGALLVPAGSKESARTLTLDVRRDPKLYRQLFERGQLAGKALSDALKQWGSQ